MREQAPVRPPFDLAEALQYTSFWWQPEDKQCFGFVLSPRRGEELRRSIRAAAERNETVRVHALVNSRFVDGLMDAPTAVIHGETDEEVLIVAHICHPQPSANDNASGVGVVLEAARVLQLLISTGKLPRPRRSIRFLLPPEIYGTYAYLAQNEQRCAKTVAAINLDMVGENQELCGSSFLVERLPEAMAAPVDTLAIAIQDELAREQHGLNDLGTFALFRYGNVPFNGSSDHAILSAPSVGIACPMLIQWPDRFYHTSFDTIDKVDPNSLRRAGLLSATYAAFLAGAGGEETVWLAHEAQIAYKTRIARSGQDAATSIRLQKIDAASGPAIATDLNRLKKRLLYLADRQQAILAWLERLGGVSISAVLRSLQSEAATIAWNEITTQSESIGGSAARAGLRAIPGVAERPRDEWDEAAQALILQPRWRGPVEVDGFLSHLSPERRDAWYATTRRHAATPHALLEMALYWADGKRTLLEIADLVELETVKRDVELLVLYVRLLQELELLA
jgi:aminopeptidase YwaD